MDEYYKMGCEAAWDNSTMYGDELATFHKLEGEARTAFLLGYSEECERRWDAYHAEGGI